MTPESGVQRLYPLVDGHLGIQESVPYVQEIPPRCIFSRSSSHAGGRDHPKIEWWFVQGRYAAAASAPRDFMCAFFRFVRYDANGEPRPLFHLLISELNLETKENRTISQADPLISAWIDDVAPPDQDSELYRAYVDELRESGIAHPIVPGPGDASVLDDPFSLGWGTFSLQSSPDGVVLAYDLPEDGGCRLFHFQPASPAWWYPPVEGGEQDMSYSSIPRLTLQGLCGGTEVSGEAWIDHQWGGQGWFQRPEETGHGIRGWDWYGINLDGGIDLMVILRREVKTGCCYAVEAVVREGTGVFGTASVSVTPIGWWTSPATGITYPVRARISLPALDCELVLAPIVDDQELMLPGAMRAVWEGAGTVSGVYRGAGVRGRARMEFFGYGYRLDFERLLASIRTRIDREIVRFFPHPSDGMDISRYIGRATWAYEPCVYADAIADPAWTLMARDGKHYRPIFAVLLLQALGVDAGPYLDLMSAIPELNHTGALIIDDIEDGSPVRRGGPSIHLSHGTEIAINAANTLYYLPWLLVEDHPHLDDRQRLLLYENMVKSAVKAHFGQGMDLFWSWRQSPARTLAWLEDNLADKILQMHADKTGIAGEQIAHGCSIIAGVADPVRRVCAEYARDLWIAFQIMDDHRDIAGGIGWRKPRGRDIAGGKLNYVIVRALSMLDAVDRERLALILALAPVHADEDLVAEGIVLVERSGALPACAREALEMAERGWSAFSPHVPASDAKVLLRAFSRKMIRL